MELVVSDKALGILTNSKISTVLQVPNMTNAEYDEIKYLVESLGGHWREKNKGFVFDDDIVTVQKRLIELLNIRKIQVSDEKLFKIKNQFYPTPDWLAVDMITRADIKSTDKVLEPSAGRGAILKHIAYKTNHYTAVEYNQSNVKCLRAQGFRVNHMSFEKYSKSTKAKFDKVVMNPPFSNEMDLRHTILAYNLLKPGGRLVGLVAENSLYYDRSITKQFNRFIDRIGGTVLEVPHGTFKESGTNVDVAMIILNKR